MVIYDGVKHIHSIELLFDSGAVDVTESHFENPPLQFVVYSSSQNFVLSSMPKHKVKRKPIPPRYSSVKLPALF